MGAAAIMATARMIAAMISGLILWSFFRLMGAGEPGYQVRSALLVLGTWEIHWVGLARYPADK